MSTSPISRASASTASFERTSSLRLSVSSPARPPTSMSVATTRAPSRAKASAVARPMPAAAAVSNATLPANRPAMWAAPSQSRSRGRPEWPPSGASRRLAAAFLADPRLRRAGRAYCQGGENWHRQRRRSRGAAGASLDRAAIAQLVEHVIRNDGVGSSNLSCGTNRLSHIVQEGFQRVGMRGSAGFNPRFGRFGYFEAKCGPGCLVPDPKHLRDGNAMTPAGDFASIVRLEGVQKYFGAVHALRDIDIVIGRNEIVGLIGDNGAGKSTLIKVMTGVLPPTSGKIFVRDREIQPTEYSVRMAHDLSIETVYQDKSLAEKQPLWRNFFVGRQITNRFGFIDIKRQKEVARQILIDVIGFRGVGITVDSTVANLSGGERQGIAIGRAMHYNADLIVLDEPTAALGVAEVRKVVEFVRKIKTSGRACIYIEHNLAHVHEVADRLVVLDRGRVVSEINPKDMTVPELTEYLIALQHQA